MSEPGRGMVIGLTGAVPGEGTTTIVKGLARQLSRHEEHRYWVLLVDCSQPSGTAQAGERPVGQDFLGEPALVYCSVRALEVDQPPVDGPRFAQILHKLRGRYAFVVFDIPPLLSDPIAVELARAVDRLYLVVRAGRTSSEAARRAVARLGNRRLEGVILNGARPRLPAWLARAVF